MSYVINDPANPPACEPVQLTDMKAYLRVNWADDDGMIAGMITAARELTEEFCRRSWVQKGYVLVMDSFPYFTDTTMSQQAYPPSYYALPQYSTTLWNYSQMMKLAYSPLIIPANGVWKPPTGNGSPFTSGDNLPIMAYVASASQAWTKISGTTDPSNPTNASFLVDAISEPPRVFPQAGQYWPSVLYVPNAVQIPFMAGYSADDSAVPERAKIAIMMLVSNWYENREASSPKSMSVLPHHIESLLWSLRVMDVAPTRG
ncbi:MAG TPA: head-tail connector protein [Terriglobia bacterium]|nr:head-tail connector protein [Terriglobia bacterium]